MGLRVTHRSISGLTAHHAHGLRHVAGSAPVLPRRRLAGSGYPMSWRGCTTWLGGGGPGICTAFHCVRFTLPLVGGVGTSRRTYGLPCAATYIEFPCESCSSQAGWPTMVTAPRYLTLLADALVREWVIEAMFRPASSWCDCSAGSSR